MKPTDNGRTKFNTDAQQFDKLRQQPGETPAPQLDPGTEQNSSMNQEQSHTRDDATKAKKQEASQTGRDVPTKSSFQGVEQNAPKKDNPEGTYRDMGGRPK